MLKPTYLFISEVSQNRKQVLIGMEKMEGLKKIQEENYKKIYHEYFEIIIPKSFSSNSDEQQKQIKKLADLQLQVNIIFISIRYERLDMMSFRLKSMIKYFQPYINNICLIITDFHKSLKKDQDYDIINRKLANESGIKLLFGYIHQDNEEILYEKNKKYSKSDFFLQPLFRYKRQIQLDGNKMGVYPQIDYQLLQKLQCRFKSMDPRQMLGKQELQKVNELQNQHTINKQQQQKETLKMVKAKGQIEQKKQIERQRIDNRIK